MTAARFSNRPDGFRPFFSICVPQHNRTDFLIKACKSFAAQSFRDFELCISDDCSTDSKTGQLLGFLKRSGLIFTYQRTKTNLRYDGNLRNAIAFSIGRYLLLMANDDALASSNELQRLRQDLMAHAPVAVAITNYRELSSGKTYRRMVRTGVVGSGPQVAAATFRRYSFVSGIVLEGDPARAAATDACDGTEMYQMFLGARLVGAGGRLLGIDRVAVEKDLQIEGQSVDSYRSAPRLKPCPIVERPLPMVRLLEVVATGLSPHHFGRARERNLLSVGRQLYAFIYPYWGVEYRRVQSWRYALGVLLAVRPGRVARGLGLSLRSRLSLFALYVASSAIALVLPLHLFDALQPRLYAFAKGRA